MKIKEQAITIRKKKQKTEGKSGNVEKRMKTQEKRNKSRKNCES